MGNIAAGFQSNCFVCYNALGQNLPVVGIGNEFFESLGVQTKHLQANNPRARFKLAGTMFKEHYATAALSGYVLINGHTVYCSTNQQRRSPLIDYGSFGLWCPYGDASQPGQGNSMVIRFTF